MSLKKPAEIFSSGFLALPKMIEKNIKENGEHFRILVCYFFTFPLADYGLMRALPDLKWLSLNIQKPNYVGFHPPQKKIDYEIVINVYDNNTGQYLSLDCQIPWCSHW